MWNWAEGRDSSSGRANSPGESREGEDYLSRRRFGKGELRKVICKVRLGLSCTSLGFYGQ